jgi:ssDNA-binding Zn-finger/Zn-ribbon topoisomerase 1
MCPDCGAALVLKTSEARGTQFFGCPKFPQCRGALGLGTHALIQHLRSESDDYRDKAIDLLARNRRLRNLLETPDKDEPTRIDKPVRIGQCLLEYWSFRSGISISEMKRISMDKQAERNRVKAMGLK